jgi:electron transport complex protein RnfD
MAFALGGLWLVSNGTADWRIPLAMLSSLLALAAVFHLYAPLYYASAGFHLFAGATLLGAFFIATDPVSASSTPHGRLLYGAGIGCLTYLIRVFGGYPDGVAFAVLLMNLAAPAIDYFTRPRVFGEPR